MFPLLFVWSVYAIPHLLGLIIPCGITEKISRTANVNEPNIFHTITLPCKVQENADEVDSILCPT
jgi:hypothetical protein